MAGLNKAQLAAKATGAGSTETESALPVSVTLASMYGYDPEIDGESIKMWAAGQVVTDADQIADLIERQAPLEAY